MVCRESGFNSYATSEVKITQGLEESQTLSLSHELMREGRTAATPTAEQVTDLINQRAAQVSASPDLTDARKLSLLRRLDRARTEPMTGRTYYSSIRLNDRAAKAKVGLDDYYGRVARDLGITRDEASKRLQASMQEATEAGRDAKAPADFVERFTADPANRNLPQDRQTLYAAHKVEQAVADRKSFSPTRPAVTDRRPISSSFMKSMGYDPETGRLEVEIASPRSSTGSITYAYRVPPSVYAKMTAVADARDGGDPKASLGSFYSTQVKGQKQYQYDSKADADAAATVRQCPSCGRFAGQGHSCPPAGDPTPPPAARPVSPAMESALAAIAPGDYEQRVLAYETEGETTSDAQARADGDDLIREMASRGVTVTRTLPDDARRAIVTYNTNNDAYIKRGWTPEEAHRLASDDVLEADRAARDTAAGMPASRPAVGARRPVKSSFIRSIGYDSQTERLEVEIESKSSPTGSTVYAYKVPPAVNDELMRRAVARDAGAGDTESIGRYYGAAVRREPSFQYASKADADTAGRVTQCPSCGQFAGAGHSCSPAASAATSTPESYDERVARYEAEGHTHSVAQYRADRDDLRKEADLDKVKAYVKRGWTPEEAHRLANYDFLEARRAAQETASKADAVTDRNSTGQCPTCGQFAGAGHGCVPGGTPPPPPAVSGAGPVRPHSNAPASPFGGSGVAMRTYRTDGLATRMPNLTAVQAAARRTEGPVLVGVHAAGSSNLSGPGTVSGAVTVRYLGSGRGYQVSLPDTADPRGRDQLKCSCPAYSMSYDCGHMRQVMADTQNRLNSSRVRDPKMVAVAREVAAGDMPRQTGTLAPWTTGTQGQNRNPSPGYAPVR